MDSSMLGNAVILVLAGILIGWLVQWLLIDRPAWSRETKAHETEVNQLQEALGRALQAKSDAQHAATEAVAQNETAQAEALSLQSQIDQLVAENNSLESELSTSSVRLRQMTAIEQANETLRNKLTAAESRIRELDAQQAVLRNEHDRAQLELQTQISELETEKRTIRDKLAEAEGELALFGAHLSTADGDLDAVEVLRAQLVEARRETERMRAQLTTATAHSERVRPLEDEVTALRQQLENAENELLNAHNRTVETDLRLQNISDELIDERDRARQLEQQLHATATTAGGGEPETLRTRIDELQSALNSARADSALLAQLKQENSDLRRQLQTPAAAASIADAAGDVLADLPPTETAPAAERLRAAVSGIQAAPAIPDGADDLQNVHGIGRVFASRLYAAGITTYAQLAELPADRLIEIVEAKTYQAVNVENWLADARRLAAQTETA